jgi:hypothetical protein
MLSKKLNISLTPVDSPDPNLPIVAVLVPSRESPKAEMTAALNAMIASCRGKAIVYTTAVLQSSVVHWTRNMLLANLIKSQTPWTHVLMMDDDMVPKADALLKMLGHKKDFVSALCTVRTDPPLPTIRWLDKSDMIYKRIYDWPKDSLIEVDATGTGMILVTRHCLEQVANAYFNCAFEREFFKLPEDWPHLQTIQSKRLEYFDKEANAFWFRFLPWIIGCNEMGEDVGFCWMATQYCGIKIYCDTSVQPDHIGNYGFGIKDYEYYKPSLIAEAEAKGEIRRKQIEPEPYSAKISILVPTRGRPENMERLFDSIADTALQMPEIVFYTDKDDEQSSRMAYALEKRYLKTAHIVGPRQTLTACWNDCYKLCDGDIVMFAADDLVFKTKNWDVMVAKAFREQDDKILFVHGDDGHWGAEFGTHGFLHRNWIDTVGYVLPPYFSSDYGDTWVNEVADALGRRKYLPFVTEHMHFLWGKAPMDATYNERLERHKKDEPGKLYAELAPKRLQDVEKLRAAMLETANVA